MKEGAAGFFNGVLAIVMDAVNRNCMMVWLESCFHQTHPMANNASEMASFGRDKKMKE